MTRMNPLRAVRQTWIDIGTAVSAAREYRQDGANCSVTPAANPQTAAIVL